MPRDPLSFNSHMSGSTPDKMREVLGWFNACLEGVPAEDRKYVSERLMSLIPKSSEEINSIDWDTYMPAEAERLLSPTEQPPLDNSLEYLPHEVSPQTPLEPEKLRTPATRPKPPKRRKSPKKKRTTEDLLRLNIKTEWATLNAEERERYKDAKRREAMEKDKRRATQGRKPRSMERHGSITQPVISPPQDHLLDPTTLDFSAPQGFIQLHGGVAVGSLLIAHLSTSNPNFHDHSPPDISWWVEEGYSRVWEVEHLRNIPEFPITSDFVGLSIICRYRPTGNLYGHVVSGNTVQAVVGPVPPCATLTPRLKIRNIVEGAMTVGSHLVLPPMRKPFTELPKWFTIRSEDPSASPPPVRGMVLDLRPEHAGCTIKVQFTLQSAGPLYCLVGTVEDMPELEMEKLGSDLGTLKKNYRGSWKKEKEGKTVLTARSESDLDQGEGSSEDELSDTATVSVMDTLREVEELPHTDPLILVPPLRMGRVSKAQEVIRMHTEASLDAAAAAQKKKVAGSKQSGLAPLFQKPVVNGVTLKVNHNQPGQKAVGALRHPKKPEPSPHKQEHHVAKQVSGLPPQAPQPAPQGAPQGEYAAPASYPGATDPSAVPVFERKAGSAEQPVAYQGRRESKRRPQEAKSGGPCECAVM